jgi:dTDP-glucose 4,6-dehydratase
MTILQFAQKVIEVSGSKSDIVFTTPKDDRFTDDPKVRQPDISKAKRVLGWEPKVDLETGLKETVAYFKDKV